MVVVVLPRLVSDRLYGGVIEQTTWFAVIVAVVSTGVASEVLLK